MAFVGHPILADIRKGMRLRPTQTVDKSCPMIRADGESLPSVQPRGPSPSPVPSPVFVPQMSSSASPLPPSHPPPPPPPPHPSTLKSPSFPSAVPRPPAPPAISIGSGGGQSDDNGRQKLLAQIRGGIRLRPVQTVDKSGLVLDEEEKQQLLRATTPNGSLDSQGKSPSPSFGGSVSPSSHGGFSSIGSPPLPSNGSIGPPIWAPSDCSSSSFSSDPFLHPSANSPRQSASSSPTPSAGQSAAIRHWPEVLTEKQKAEEGKIPKKGDFQFDEQKQIEERQKEVAALSGRGGAASKIAAFRQLQGQPQEQQPLAPRPSAAFSTLPRAQKANGIVGGGGNGQMANGTAGRGPTMNKQPQQQSQMNNGQLQQQQQQPQRANGIGMNGAGGGNPQQKHQQQPQQMPKMAPSQQQKNVPQTRPSAVGVIKKPQQQPSQQQQQQQTIQSQTTASSNSASPSSFYHHKKQQAPPPPPPSQFHHHQQYSHHQLQPNPQQSPCHWPSVPTHPPPPPPPPSSHFNMSSSSPSSNGNANAHHVHVQPHQKNVHPPPPPPASPLPSPSNAPIPLSIVPNHHHLPPSFAQQVPSSSSQYSSKQATLAPTVACVPDAPRAPSPSPSSTPFFRSYTPRPTGGGQQNDTHRQNFNRIRGQFTNGNGNGEEEAGPPSNNGNRGGAEMIWKEAAQQRKGQMMMMNGTGGKTKSPIPPPLPKCPPPPLDNGTTDWEALRQEFKFAVDLDAGPDGQSLIRIVRR